MTDARDPDELDTMIEDCEVRDEKLSEWEAQFIDSISHQRAKGSSLSEKQVEILDRIWEKVTA